MIFLSIIATLLTLGWIILLFLVGQEEWNLAAINQILHNRDEIDKLKKKAQVNTEKLSVYHGFSLKFMKAFYEVDFSKQISKLENTNEQIQNGNLKKVSIFIMPGYAVMKMFPLLCHNSVFKGLVSCFSELSGRKYAEYRAKDLMAKIISIPIIGVAMALVVMIIISALAGTKMGLIFGGTIVLLVMIISYAMYDEVSDKLNKRRISIRRQFPNVVSKMALLSTSGMIVSKAWKETAYSKDMEIYMEMRRTSEELDNLVKPEEAYMNFIARCNTKETTKLASAIMQNLSKGNAEIGKLLKEMASDAWVERQQMAKKDGENANSKLMIPTMLLFLSILIMIIVPFMTNMGI